MEAAPCSRHQARHDGRAAPFLQRRLGSFTINHHGLQEAALKNLPSSFGGNKARLFAAGWVEASEELKCTSTPSHMGCSLPDV